MQEAGSSGDAERATRWILPREPGTCLIACSQPRAINDGGVVQLIGEYGCLRVAAQGRDDCHVGGKACGTQHALLRALQLRQAPLQRPVQMGVAPNDR